MNLTLCGLVLVGCSIGPTDLPEVAPVSGTVTLDGKPLNNATLTFQPAVGRPSSGLTNKDGQYKLRYNLNLTGAKLGDHSVIITTYQEFDNPSDADRPASPELLPAKYHKKSELVAKITNGDNVVDFDLKSK
ncbi:carboxypeptidase regulatory-like domain-containing protein [Blastopirellula sp. J2-11]|uniref:carboxypeptidase regulatory-like domain-containing protein n=1 Tax=Blastopirellula sp. J2-11 TaxID=2943192 RepID=UPI0021C6B7F2|nr:carboxypeptidase regulatory-like domain-containing protein [Blastopirellula sp. J2-11]UUO07853.1 carboxypeptidase regulatory-like domain-containing protein [Blastopirellula sp. J2-11]